MIDPEKDEKMVDEMLEFKEKLDRFLHECFHNNEKYSNTLKDSFEYFTNQRANKPAELIGESARDASRIQSLTGSSSSESSRRPIANGKQRGVGGRTGEDSG